MDKPKLKWQDNQNLALSGPLSFASVPYLWQQSRPLLTSAQASNLLMNLGKVTYSDSSGVALLLAWVGLRRQQKRTIHFSQVPVSILAIIRVTDLVGILTIVA